MEFREYSNPEGRDYDIKSSLNNNDSFAFKNIQESNKYYMQLFELMAY